MELKNCPRMEIHSHSHFSNIRLLDSINKPKDLILKAYELGLSGITLTDHETVAGSVEWLQLEKQFKEEGKIPFDFKCALGNEIYLINNRGENTRYWHFILIAKDTIGWHALCRLSSIAWQNSFSKKGMTRVPTEKKEFKEVLEPVKGHVIASTACIGSEFAGLTLSLVELENEKNYDAAALKKQEIVDFISFCQEVIGKDDFYIEMAPSQSPDQIKYNKKAKEIAKALGIKVVLGGDAHYLTAEDRPRHKAYLNSKEGEREVDAFYYYAHLMDNEEAFNNLEDVFTEEEFREVCANSMEIYEKIDKYDIFHKPIIPRVSVPYRPKSKVDDNFRERYPVLARLIEGGNDQERYWVNYCVDELRNRKLWNEIYLQRLETEADVIDTIGSKLENCLFEYFNTFQHYIDLFWECGSLSGPGRGSSVCFLSNYLLGITQLDPVKWNLPYWRFLNKERLELPDIDTDLSPSKRKLIFKKIREERGELNLVQVATFATEGTRSAILASCRGYRSKDFPNGIDVDVGQYMTSLIPQERGFLWSMHDVVYGNEEKGRKPIQAFLNEVQRYPGLLENIMSIEGLICRRGQHASGVMLYNNSPFETTAIMRSPNGDLTTQFSLHESEALGDTKFDFLVTEICDKITNCINLLKEDGYFSDCSTLREIYEGYFHPSKLDLEDNRIWRSLAAGDTMDIFQFNSDVGLQAAKAIRPENPIEMTMANALMRLMGEKGQERPLDRYVRLKNDVDLWYQEVRSVGLSEEEINVLEKYYLPRYGVPATQEDLMMVCMDKEIAHFTLKEANAARKIVAKKKMEQVEELKDKFISQCSNPILGKYVWATTMGPQMGYSFALPHALAYSFVGIQTLVLANEYPKIYWNTACLITNSGGNEESDEIDEEEEAETGKKKIKNANYGKVASAIGQMSKAGIKVSPPDINLSSYTFKPLAKENRIIYGLKGITRVGADVIDEIMSNRPYKSIDDFLSKVKVNKTQMVNLIKSGAFDSFGDREELMHEYIYSIADIKKRLTLQNCQMLISYNLIPIEYDFQIRVFNYNKYLKKLKSGIYFNLDNIAIHFYQNYFDMDLLESGSSESGFIIKQTSWKKIYDGEMAKIRTYIKNNNQELLTTMNNMIVQDIWKKYCLGSLSKWEMDSVSFYSHPHELANIDNSLYNFANFFSLPPQPVVDRFIPIKGQQIPLYKIERLAGTVLDKNKNKNSVTLLTTDGVVTVKIFGPIFANYDKQISEKQTDGTKKVIEKSWFTRGNKIIVCGVRRDDQFLAKKYKNTPHHLVELITDIHEDGSLEVQGERCS